MATSPIIPEAPVAIGRRHASRARVQLNAMLETTTDQVQVVLRNLSCTGAMLQGLRLPPVNRTALLKRGSLDVIGVVVWREQDHCGFHFFDAISHEQVVAEARRAPETTIAGHRSHWALAENVTTPEQWGKAAQSALRERQKLRGLC